MPGAIAWVIVGLVVLAISAKFSPGTGDLLTTVCGFICLAQSWNVIAGYGGQVSLGTSAFAGVGAYSAALVAIHLQLPATFMLLFGLVAGTLLALLLAVPLLRLRGDYFSIGTLVASLALQAWALNWSFVGGSTGLSLPLESLPAPLQVLRLSIVVATVSMLAAWTIAHSRVGLRLRAVRDDEGAARGVGVSGFLSRALALCVSGGLAGLAGALIAIQQISFEPTGMLGLGWTVSALLMTVVGGPGSVLGPVFGVVIVYWGLTKQLAGRESASHRHRRCATALDRSVRSRGRMALLGEPRPRWCGPVASPAVKPGRGLCAACATDGSCNQRQPPAKPRRGLLDFGRIGVIWVQLGARVRHRVRDARQDIRVELGLASGDALGSWERVCGSWV